MSKPEVQKEVCQVLRGLEIQQDQKEDTKYNDDDCYDVNKKPHHLEIKMAELRAATHNSDVRNGYHMSQQVRRIRLQPIKPPWIRRWLMNGIEHANQNLKVSRD